MVEIKHVKSWGPMTSKAGPVVKRNYEWGLDSVEQYDIHLPLCYATNDEYVITLSRPFLEKVLEEGAKALALSDESEEEEEVPYNYDDYLADKVDYNDSSYIEESLE